MLFRVFNTLFISILFLTFSFTQNDRDLFVISGYVLLEDSLDAGGTHEGITISIKSLIDTPPTLVTSSESDEDGFLWVGGHNGMTQLRIEQSGNLSRLENFSNEP